MFQNLFFIYNINSLLTYIIILCKIICILISVAYFTIAERKIMAAIQRRLGPNIEGGVAGLLQPLADGLKLIIKELIIPNYAKVIIFFLAPSIIFILSVLNWTLIPFYIDTSIGNLKLSLTFYDIILYTNFVTIANIEFGLLFLLMTSSLNVYGIILGGWASNSKYAFLGALRSTAQMISYEVFLGLTLLPIICICNSFNLTDIIYIQIKFGWFFIPFMPITVIFIISMLAETNRAPFDLPEAEAELVAGYNIEYSAIIFALFFLGEYCNMLLMSTLLIILFFGGWDCPINIVWLQPFFFSFKIILVNYLFILVRASFPRYRYDQLMDIGWKSFLPLTLGFIIFTIMLIMLYKINLIVLF